MDNITETLHKWRHATALHHILLASSLKLQWCSLDHCSAHFSVSPSDPEKQINTTKMNHVLTKGSLTHYQTTNFRLFQIERVCRRQFQIWQKWQKVIQTGRKHCGKRRNCSLQAISPFPTVFSQGHQKVSLCGNGLTLSPNKSWFLHVCSISLLKTQWEREKLLERSNFSLFPQCFLPLWRTSWHFHQIWNCRLLTHSVWKSLKFVIWERVNAFLWCTSIIPHR